MTKLMPLVGVMLAGATSAGCVKAEGRESRPAHPVKAEAVTAAPVPGGIRYSATIEPLEQVAVAFRSSGYVDDLLRRRGADGRFRSAQPGDAIARGTVLARVRESDYRERVSQGRARLAEGEASLTKARLDLERARTLFAADSLTRPELDAAQAAFDAGAARVAAARGDVELAAIALRDCTLVAPAGGVILERRIEVGTLAGAGTIAFVIGDVSAVKARFGIPDSMVQAVKPGDAISVGVEAVAASSFAGRVTAVAPAADPQSRVFDVEVTIVNTGGRLRPGMIGTVTLGPTQTSAADARPLAVPLTAIVRSGAGAGQFAVFIVERRDGGEVARVRPVELGAVLGNTITVRNGVTRGERVIVSGATLLADGDSVRVLP